MKLTNYMRDAFVRSAMDDVPSIDYTEQIRAAVMKEAVALLPPKVRAVWQDAACRAYLESNYITIGNVGVAAVPGPNGDGYKTARKKIEDAVADLVAKSKAQGERNKALNEKLRACAYSASTRKQLAELLPEFEKYLPPDEAAALRSLPVVANVVADFVKAGWPKNAKAKRVAQAA